jgi:hypothetical protein
MAHTEPGDERFALREVLRRIEAAWTSGRFHELEDCFHEGIVCVPPGFSMQVEGRAACIESYADFMGAARVTEYRQSEPAIDVWGDVAVATYPWEMAWEMKGQAHRESGHDVIVFARQMGRWVAVWRTIVPKG